MTNYLIRPPAYQVARINCQAVGVAILQGKAPDLFRMYVAASHRGKGIGAALLGRVLHDVAEQGAESYTVGSHPTARSFVARAVEGHKYTVDADGVFTVWF